MSHNLKDSKVKRGELAILSKLMNPDKTDLEASREAGLKTASAIKEYKKWLAPVDYRDREVMSYVLNKNFETLSVAIEAQNEFVIWVLLKQQGWEKLNREEVQEMNKIVSESFKRQRLVSWQSTENVEVQVWANEKVLSILEKNGLL